MHGGFADLARITDSPDSITVNKGEIATFSCTATSASDINIEWDAGGELYNNETCSESPTCESTYSEINNKFVTSILQITAIKSLNISCVVNQTFSGEPDVEIRLPPTRTVQEAAQLIAIPVFTTAVTTSSKPGETA